MKMQVEQFDCYQISRYYAQFSIRIGRMRLCLSVMNVKLVFQGTVTIYHNEACQNAAVLT